MATERKKNAAAETGRGFVYLPLIAGWLVPGAGHFLLRKWGRGTLLAASVLGMFVLGIAMQGKLYSGAHDVLDMLGLAGDLGNGLLYCAEPDAGPGRGPGAGDHRRLRHPLYRGRRAAERDCRRGRAQSAHREETLVLPPSHFAALALFALFASVVFGITQRDTPPRMLRYGIYCFVLFRGLGDSAQLADVPDCAVAVLP